jgi:glycosyltransferase involved in cell wall biosynthesis
VAKRSINWATYTVAPSQAFASELERWSGKRVMAIHHGFDQNAFIHNSSALAPELEEKLKLPSKCIKLLFVSHYNYYRNFETLIRALPVLRDRLGGLPFRLLLSCHLQTNQKHGTYNPAEAAALVHTLGLREFVIELGSVPYEQLHHIYARADAYVTPAYTETFAHPLVEAMASGLPIIASDLSVHREICGEAAKYFPKFSSESLSETVAKVVLSPQLKSQLVDAGTRRVLQFSWKTHVNEILAVCEQALKSYSAVGQSS